MDCACGHWCMVYCNTNTNSNTKTNIRVLRHNVTLALTVTLTVTVVAVVPERKSNEVEENHHLSNTYNQNRLRNTEPTIRGSYLVYFQTRLWVCLVRSVSLQSCRQSGKYPTTFTSPLGIKYCVDWFLFHDRLP